MQDELSELIAADLGITDVPQEDKQRIIAQFGEVALKAATLAVIGKLSDQKREEFIKLAEAGDTTALKVFLDGEVPGHEDLVKAAVAEEVKKFKEFQTP
jgi:hypothetical protein